jgi:hypothetical protein
MTNRAKKERIFSSCLGTWYRCIKLEKKKTNIIIKKINNIQGTTDQSNLSYIVAKLEERSSFNPADAKIASKLQNPRPARQLVVQIITN